MKAAWVLTGPGGQLGKDICARLAFSNSTKSVLVHKLTIDITKFNDVTKAIHELRPSVVVNTAAWNAVDDAELAEEFANQVNGHAVGNLATACSSVGAKFIHLSTDYVFDGTSNSPIAENSITAPINAYGRSKALGERLARSACSDALIVRTAWLYGAGGDNFVKRVLNLARSEDSLSVVDDQIGQPTWSRDLADQLIKLATSPVRRGVFHGTNGGQTSWFDFAREILRLCGEDTERVRPINSRALGRRARRPAYSVLGHGSWKEAGLVPMREWREALVEAFPLILKSMESER